MLVSKKQEWEMIEQFDNPTAPAPSQLQLDAPLRRNCLVLVVVISLMAMIMTIQSELLVRSGYELVETKQQIATIEKENAVFQLDVAKLKSPNRIEQIATNQLGMVLPSVVYHSQTTTSSIHEKAPLVAKNSKAAPVLSMNSAETGQKTKN